MSEITTRDTTMPLVPSTLEDIDFAMFDYVNKTLNIHIDNHDKFTKVPVVWATAERVYQVKKDSEFRDTEGTLKYPLIVIERTGMDKSLSRKGRFFGNVPPTNDHKRNNFKVYTRIKQDKTANFSNAEAQKITKGAHINFVTPNKNKVVYEHLMVPMPVHVELKYQISLISEYQQHINTMTTPFLTNPGNINYFVMQRNDHIYEGFISENFTHDNTIADLGEEERKFQTNIDIEVIGYLLGEGNNQKQPLVIKRETVVDIKIPRERSIVGNINTYIDKPRDFNRE